LSDVQKVKLDVQKAIFDVQQVMFDFQQPGYFLQTTSDYRQVFPVSQMAQLHHQKAPSDFWMTQQNRQQLAQKTEKVK
jgi:hypothetical protein